MTCVGKGDSLLVAHHATPPVFVAAGAKKDALKLEQKVRPFPPTTRRLAREGPRNTDTFCYNQIHFVQYDVSANGAVLAQGALPVAPGATLTWLGFVEDACSAVAFGSSDGAVSVRTPDFGGAFAPVFRSADTKTQDSEHHWVVAVSVADDVRSGTCRISQSRLPVCSYETDTFLWPNHRRGFVLRRVPQRRRPERAPQAGANAHAFVHPRGPSRRQFGRFRGRRREGARGGCPGVVLGGEERQ